MMEIIDFHTHPYLTRLRMPVYTRKPFSGPDQAVEDLKRAGITHICGSVIEAEALPSGGLCRA